MYKKQYPVLDARLNDRPIRINKTLEKRQELINEAKKLEKEQFFIYYLCVFFIVVAFLAALIYVVTSNVTY